MQRNRIAIITFLFLAFSTISQPSYATNKVSSPEVTQDKLELEYRAGYDIDDRNSRDGASQHKFLVNYGISDRLRPEIKLVINDSATGDTRVSGVEPGLKWQFLEKDEAWVSAALEGVYKLSTQSHGIDVFESKLLLGKQTGKLHHLANIAVEHEIGAGRRSGTALIASWKTKYHLTDYAEPGIEFHSNFGKLNDGLSYNEQNHQLGPSISGGIGENFRYDIGYLFGVSDAATDGRIKLILGYIVQF